MKIEAGKTYKTRDGRKVRVICADVLDKKFPVAGALTSDDGTYELICSFTPEGRYGLSFNGSHNDLVAEWHEPEVMWLVVNKGSWMGFYRNEKNALNDPETRYPGARVVKMVEVQS